MEHRRHLDRLLDPASRLDRPRSPEVTGPHGVRQAVERIRAAQPDLRFQIDTILGDGDLIAVIGSVSQSAQHPTTRMVCLIGMKDGRMAVMRTYRDTSE
ncbi:nuclear transport factor 2 family protein [Spirillospora sp. NPDC048832]